MADRTVQDLIREEAQKAGVPPELALAVAEQESSFNPTAVGPRLGTGESAIGTFQLLPSTAKRLGVDPNDPVANIQGGTKYLRELLDRHQGDLQKVLAEYGGVKTDTKYVPSVMERVGKYRTAQATPAAPPPTPSQPPQARGRAATSTAMASMLGLDPRTSQGRRNLAGGAGALAATALAPELALPALAARVASAAIPAVGAYLGGATEQAGEDLVSGGPPSLSSMRSAGRQQMAYEAGGQVVGGVVKGVARRIGASAISKRVSQGLSDALDAVGSRLQSKRPNVTPGQAGELFHEVTQGPAQSVKDQLGRDVEAAATQGPPIPTQPLKDRLVELSQQITPMASHAQAPKIPGYSPAQVQALVQKNPSLLVPPDHPLPAALAKVEEMLGDSTEIAFEDAHKIKRLLDDVTNWESPAKKQVQQLTKGFRSSLRSAMASHRPYNEATDAYSTVARLYKDVGASKLHNAILSKPSAVVDKIGWENPASVKLVKEITQLPTDQAGQAQGEAAWYAVRSAWTNENLIALGPKRMANEIDRIEASNAGQEFVKEMYGDPAGKTQWENLKQIAQALRDAQGATKEFAKTSLARAAEPSGVVRDVGYMMLPGHGITRLGAASRIVLGRGSSATEMLEWASRTPATTQFVIKHVLTGPNPGMALADLARWYSTKDDVKPAVSHDQGPPTPTSLRR